jgi:predicted nucleic acid-binding protein
MFLLDTNVLSAMMKEAPEPRLAAWVAGQRASSLFTATVCQAEIFAGLAVMPHGRRRRGLEVAALAMFEKDFAGRVWPFDAAAALEYGAIFVLRREAGRPIATMDLMIAAIARARGAAVVTRDAGGFAGCGVGVVDPWGES